MPHPLNTYQIEKLGNTLLYLANHVGEFTKTKALKLLFLLEEKSIKEYGIPFFGFDFKVWQYGPVNELVYEDLTNEGMPLLRKYIQRVKEVPEELEASAEFNDDEFSNNDISLLKEIIKFAKNKTARNLVDITHGKGSLWATTAEENGILKALEEQKLPRTDIVIDFSKLISDDKYLTERYENSLDYIKFSNHVKAQ